jgi:hypothetical protein
MKILSSAPRLTTSSLACAARARDESNQYGATQDTTISLPRTLKKEIKNLLVSVPNDESRAMSDLIMSELQAIQRLLRLNEIKGTKKRRKFIACLRDFLMLSTLVFGRT